MKAPHFIWLMLLLGATLSVSAQTSEKCSAVWVDTASARVKAGEPILFKARVNNSKVVGEPQYHWEVSAGTIAQGEGTANITVDTAGLGGQSIRTTVELAGITTDCSNQYSFSVAVEPPDICDLLFDEYGDIRFEDEKARLDNFAIQLMNQPDFRGQITVFAGRETYEHEATDRLVRAMNYLVKVRGVPQQKLILINAGYLEDISTHLNLLPPGFGVLPFEGTPGMLLQSEVHFSRRPGSQSAKKK